MPELPEVEMATRGIRPHLEGQTIHHVNIYEPRLMSQEEAKKLKGLTVEQVDRIGKWILCHLTGEMVLLMHLRLTGSLLWHQEEEVASHERGRLSFASGYLSLVDPRGFGTWNLMTRDAVYQKLSALSKEPIEVGYSGAYLRERLGKTRRAIKTAILDQTVASGMGNIYVDEALWAVKIHPETPSNLLSLENDEQLAMAMRSALQQGLDHGGSSVRNYYHTDGTQGSHQMHLNVYSKRGEPCPRCQTKIERIVVGGRGTHFCPHCQNKETTEA